VELIDGNVPKYLLNRVKARNEIKAKVAHPHPHDISSIISECLVSYRSRRQWALMEAIIDDISCGGRGAAISLLNARG